MKNRKHCDCGQPATIKTTRGRDFICQDCWDKEVNMQENIIVRKPYVPYEELEETKRMIKKGYRMVWKKRGMKAPKF